MACTPQTGGGGVFGNFVSEWLPLLLNVFLAVQMLKLQEEMEEKMDAIAKKSLCAAESLFDHHFELLDFSEEVYNFSNTQPLYRPCDRSVHAISGLKQVTSLTNRAMGGTSRYDCGNRRQIAYDSVSTALLATAGEQESSHQFELNVSDSYLENHYNSIVSVATGRQPANIASAFNGSASIWGEQFVAASTQTTGAIASVGHYLKRVF